MNNRQDGSLGELDLPIHSRITLEPYARFLEFKIAFNRQFKASVAALTYVSRIVAANGGTRVMQSLVADTGEPWNKDFNWKNPGSDLAQALLDTTLLGVVQIQSAVEDTLTGFRGDLARWLAFCGQGIPRQPDMEDDSDDVERFYVDLLGGMPSKFDVLRPVRRYYRVTRNCIAHRSALASRGLVAVCRDPALKAALAAWPKRAKAILPELPLFHESQEIVLLPRHTIFCLETAYRSVLLLNSETVQLLGTRGIVYLAAHSTLLAGVRRTAAQDYKSADAVVSDVLSARYRVQTSADEVIKTLVDLGIWKSCLTEFHNMYGRRVPKRARRKQ